MIDPPKEQQPQHTLASLKDKKVLGSAINILCVSGIPNLLACFCIKLAKIGLAT